jgi:hypothetical protein
MKITGIYGIISITGLMFLLTMLTARAVTVYSNDFDSGSTSLSDFSIGTITGNRGTYSTSVVSGQLQINTGNTTPCYGRATINTSHFSAPYSSVLKKNPGLVTWAFNVSNQDGQWNNCFHVALGSNVIDPLVYTSTSYVFSGGGYVGNKIVIFKHSQSTGLSYFIDVNNGLSTLPSKGSIRITYNPATDLWSLYGMFGNSYIDPMSVTTLLASTVDNSFTSLNLPYISFIGDDTGVDYFDNFTVSVIPEPATLLLLGLGGMMMRKK